MTEAAREYRYVVDRDGRIFHDGTEIVDPAVLRFFLRAMTRTDDGRCLVLCQGERNWFAASDTPFVVQRLRLSLEGSALQAVELCFQGDYREPLDPATLESERDLLFCRIRGGAFRARFGRVAVQQIAPFLMDVGEGSALVMSGRRHPVRSGGERPS
ncbi:MAG TPA: hypothetical protein VIG37_08675 [Methylomirabilota bacterium]|jgi:hypothetical protein